MYSASIVSFLKDRVHSCVLQPSVLFADPGRECVPGSRAVRARRGELLNLSNRGDLRVHALHKFFIQLTGR